MKRRQLINDYATRQVPATICLYLYLSISSISVYEEAGPGRVLGSGNISVGQSAGRHGFIARWAGFCQAGSDFRQDL